MKNNINIGTIGRGRRPMTARRGFTLVEMLVSLAVIAVAMVVVVTAFTITTRTTRQAAAYSEANAWSRQFMQQIEEDLKFCDPAKSVLVLVGRTQPAGLTAADLPARKYLRTLVGDPTAVPNNYDPEYATALDPPGGNGVSEYSDPRADILMFFTNRASVSQAPAVNPQGNSDATARAKQLAYASGAKNSPLQIVYGHSAFGVAQQPAASSSFFTNTLNHIEDTLPGGDARSKLPANQWHLARRAVIIDALADDGSPPILDFNAVPNQFDRLMRCYSENALVAADVAPLTYQLFLDTLGQLATYRPYDNSFPANGLNFINGVMYPGGNVAKHHVATLLPDPPADLASNTGVFMLPGCAWFQVEFLMPEDPRNSLDHPSASQRSSTPRWVEVVPGQTYVFVPDTAANREAILQTPAAGGRKGDFAYIDPTLPPADRDKASNRRIRLWPYAIRVTVRVYDPRGRLPDPIVRTLVHRFD